MFSVVIPLYNKERHIVNTVNTVLDQTFQDFEIIIMDDGSTDNSLKAAKSIKSDKVRIFTQENAGVSVARNRGASEAIYDYIVFLDADDGLMPDFLQEIYNAIQVYPGAGLYATNFYNYKSKFDRYILREIDFLPEISIVDNYFETILENGSILGPVAVYRKDVFKATGGFVKGMIRAQDTFLLKKTLLSDDLCFINKPLYYFTYDSDNKATDEYKPAKTDISLLDLLGSGVPGADEIMIRYSLGDTEALIRSGYKDSAVTKLNNIKEAIPSRLEYMLERRMERINRLLKIPSIFFRWKRDIIKKAVYCKDLLTYYREKYVKN